MGGESYWFRHIGVRTFGCSANFVVPEYLLFSARHIQKINCERCLQHPKFS